MKQALSLLALLFCCLGVGAQAATSRPAPSAFEQASALPGGAAAVVTAERVLKQRGFGYADMQAKTPFDAHTLQNVGSVSKTVVGVALVKGIELGWFDLDTDIERILPYKIGKPGAAPITIRHLATHTSGIVDDDAVYGHSYYLTAHARKDRALYRQFKRDYTLGQRRDLGLANFLRAYLAADGRYFKKSNFSKAAPGSAYVYSNIAAALAAHLVEIKSGQSFEQFTQQHIFLPLGMRSTSWQPGAEAMKRHATVYNRKLQAYPHYGLITYPDGGLTSSAADLSAYLMAMMRGYGGQPSILSKEGFRLLFDKQFADDKIPAGSPKGEPNSGVFWRIKRNGHIGHTGSDPGITAFLFFDPASGKGKILLTNTEFGGAGEAEEARVEQQFLALWKALDTLD